MRGKSALRAVNKFAFAIEIHAERQGARERHVACADGLNLCFGLIAVGSERHEMLVEQRSNRHLRDDALDEGTAVPSGVAPVLDEDKLPFAFRGGERVGKTRVPAYRAAIIKVRV